MPGWPTDPPAPPVRMGSDWPYLVAVAASSVLVLLFVAAALARL